MSQHAMAYDPTLDRVVVFGEVNDQWDWQGGGTARAGQVMAVDFLRAGTAGDETLEEVEVSWYAGGTGYLEEGETSHGVDLKVWDEGMWKTVATAEGSPDAPALAHKTFTQPQQVRRLFFGDADTLYFAVAPVTPNGPGGADIADPECDCKYGKVATDYAEVTVRYRLPKP